MVSELCFDTRPRDSTLKFSLYLVVMRSALTRQRSPKLASFVTSPWFYHFWKSAGLANSGGNDVEADFFRGTLESRIRADTLQQLLPGR